MINYSCHNLYITQIDDIMKHLTNYEKFTLNEAKDKSIIHVENRGLSKEVEKEFLNNIVSFIQNSPKLSDIVDKKIELEGDNKIIVDKRGHNIMFKMKKDFNEKIKVYIDSDIFIHGSKKQIIDLLVEKGADAPISEIKPEIKPEEATKINTNSISSKPEFINKYVDVINMIKTQGLEKGMPVLSQYFMRELFSQYKNYVMFVQDFLNNTQNYGIDVDGKYGINTASAIKTFQENNHLSVDGMVGSKTLEKIMEIIGHPITGLKNFNLKPIEKPLVQNASKKATNTPFLASSNVEETKLKQVMTSLGIKMEEFKKYMYNLTSGGRMPISSVDINYFYKIFTKVRSANAATAIQYFWNKWAAESGLKANFEQLISRFEEGSHKDVIMGMLYGGPTIWAILIHHAVTGAGTIDSIFEVMENFLSSTPPNKKFAELVKNSYQKKYGETLQHAIEDDVDLTDIPNTVKFFDIA